MGPVLLVGQSHRDEFRAIVELLQAAGLLVTSANIADAIAQVDRTPNVELVLVAAATRDQFRSAELLALLRRQPLVEWWLLVGPWLEGETRSGRPRPGVRRFYPDQALMELRRRLAAAGNCERPRADWCPPTLTAEERWLVAGPAWPQATGCVRICSELPDARQSLATVCRVMGLTTVSHAPDDQVDAPDVAAVIYDAVAARDRWCQHVQRLAADRPRSLVVLVNFPRPDEIQRLLAAGATDVLGKPFRIDDLRSTILT